MAWNTEICNSAELSDGRSMLRHYRGIGCGGSGFEGGADAVFGAEGNGGLRNYGMTGDEAETKFLSDGGDEELRFHQRESVADALTRAAAEGEIGEARQALLQIAVPALGTEG